MATKETRVSQLPLVGSLISTDKVVVLVNGITSIAEVTAVTLAAFSGKTTDNLSEGGLNQYYTNTKVKDKVFQMLQAGSNITLGYNNDTITINATGDVRSVNTKTGYVSLTTDDIPEGTPKYFTDERVDDRVANLLQAGTNVTLTYNDNLNTLRIDATGNVSSVNGQTGSVVLSTTNVSEGTNLYYSQNKFDIAFSAKSTTDLIEGTNQYFTQTKVRTTPLTGLLLDSGAVVTPVDTIVTGVSKLQVQSSSLLSTVNAHTSNTSNPHGVTKAQVGLSNVDNTSDANKPISSATQAAINSLQSVVENAQTELVVVPNAGINITDSQIKTLYNTNIGNGVNSIAVGGAPVLPASTWKSKTIVEALDIILFPTILASIQSNKSADLSITGTSGNLEVGFSQTRTLNANLNRGTILNGDGSVNANPLVGAAISYVFSGTGFAPITQSVSSYSFTSAVVNGSNSWAVTISHNAGTGLYYDNKAAVGNNLDGSRASGTVTQSASSPEIIGYYPYFWGVSNTVLTPAAIAAIIQSGGGNKVIADASGTVTVTFNASNQYLWMVHPAIYTTKTKWYNTALNNGNIGSGSDLFGVVNTQAVNSATNLWSNINYKCYISSFSTTTSGSIEFRNS